MRTISIKFRHPLTSQLLLIASGTIDKNTIESGNTILMDPNIVNGDYFRRTGKTFMDPQRGLCEYIALIDPQSSKIINKEIGWLYIRPNPGMEQVDGFYGFFKTSHQGLEVDIDSTETETTDLK